MSTTFKTGDYVKIVKFLHNGRDSEYLTELNQNYAGTIGVINYYDEGSAYESADLKFNTDAITVIGGFFDTELSPSTKKEYETQQILNNLG